MSIPIMMRAWHRLSVSLALAAIVAASALATSASSQVDVRAPTPAACLALATLASPGMTILNAEMVTAHSFADGAGAPLQSLPPFCRVAGVLAPAITFEVWLPTQWNGKLHGVGNGANAGSIAYPAMAAALRRGYATVSTDTGHHTTNSRDGAWAVGHPELVVDFGYRAVHETTVTAKAILKAFYQQAESHSYFASCSTGGRQALMEAQRFPDDYDGIVAGDPAVNWTRFELGGHLWIALALNKDPDSYIPATKLPAIDRAVTTACDALDGIKDGVIDDPRRCNFDPVALVCNGDTPSSECLTVKQAAAVRAIWSGARDSRGQLIYPAYMPGAESAGGWEAYMTGNGPLTGNHWEQAENVAKFMVFENAQWDFRTFNYDRDVAFAEKKLGATMDAFDPDLKAFEARRGKLLLYHGWNDPSISPLNTINYYEQVISAMQGTSDRLAAERRVRQFARLFMVPGMLHCSGGPGPSSFDMLTALESWVEHGTAPDRVLASRVTKGTVDRTRPLCPYPETAIYSGSGSTDAAENFSCRRP